MIYNSVNHVCCSAAERTAVVAVVIGFGAVAAVAAVAGVME